MKKMIRSFMGLALVLTMMMSLAACGGNGGSGGSGPEGTYKMTEVSQGGVTYNMEELKTQTDALNLPESSGEIVINADGTFTFTMNLLGSEMSADGTYTVDGSSITMEIEGQAITCSLDGNKITMEQDGASIVFEK